MKRVHTDGPAAGIPDRAVGRGRGARPLRSGADAHTTNQRMEVIAEIIEALRESDEDPIEIVSDSYYVVKCFNDRGTSGGSSQWKNSQGKPVANRDLWESCSP